MSKNVEREFDLVIFGATGFTGFFMIKELVQSIASKPDIYGALKWAVAGRNSSKLSDALNKASVELGEDLSKVGKIEADVGNIKSLMSMARRTKLIINAVGPYRLYGRPVVEACVHAGTHHLDISGEPKYVEETQINFSRKALQNKALVISTCGVDSIPVDLGVQLLKQNFPGKLNWVETVIKVRPGDEGYVFNSGTFNSVLQAIADSLQYNRVHARLYEEVLTEKLPPCESKLHTNVLPFTRPEIPGWNTLFVGADKPVAERTQHYNYVHDQEWPTQIETYINIGSFLSLILYLILSSICLPLAFFGPTRRLLERYPRLFTAGYFSTVGPTRAQIEQTKFELYLFGKGTSKDGTEQRMMAQVSGPDPAYRSTSTLVVQCALTILTERSQMPSGGVLTPAAAFQRTSLIEKFANRGIKFEIVA